MKKYCTSIDGLLKALNICLDTDLPDSNTYESRHFIRPARTESSARLLQEEIDSMAVSYIKEEFIKEILMVHGKPFLVWCKL